ncbi:MAG: GDP-L-fucose synthase [Chlorobia bacterium]|nr:GDP-L-fucose synthase [Fimbriimonadaceae bacterium]
MKKTDKTFLAGHRGLVGSAIHKRLLAGGYENVIVRTRSELDLQDQKAVYDFYSEEKPDAVILAAAKVGGIHANRTYPADFIGENLVIQNNVIWGAHLADVPQLQFLGSSCIYPRETTQPIPENALLTGKPEPTNAPYAIAKIAGLYLCDSIQRQFGRNYFTVMPPNAYGDRDNYDLQTSHVLPALVRKFHEALPTRPVTCWGTGTPRREFLHSDDIADACVFLLEQERVSGHVNVGTGSSVSIRELAETIQRIVGHQGEILWDTSMPDGFPEKTMDVAKLFGMGWRPKISLEQGITSAYRWFLENRVLAEKSR